jgi:hypothetical protein
MIEQDVVTSLKHDIEAFFQEKYGPLSFQYNHLIPREKDEAKLDVTIKGENDFIRRYVGTVSYIDGQLSFKDVVRLW